MECCHQEIYSESYVVAHGKMAHNVSMGKEHYYFGKHQPSIVNTEVQKQNEPK